MEGVTDPNLQVRTTPRAWGVHHPCPGPQAAATKVLLRQRPLL